MLGHAPAKPAAGCSRLASNRQHSRPCPAQHGWQGAVMRACHQAVGASLTSSHGACFSAHSSMLLRSARFGTSCTGSASGWPVAGQERLPCDSQRSMHGRSYLRRERRGRGKHAGSAHECAAMPFPASQPALVECMAAQSNSQAMAAGRWEGHWPSPANVACALLKVTRAAPTVTKVDRGSAEKRSGLPSCTHVWPVAATTTGSRMIWSEMGQKKCRGAPAAAARLSRSSPGPPSRAPPPCAASRAWGSGQRIGECSCGSQQHESQVPALRENAWA